ncbi:hypothetical protein B7P43_G01410 [Cryptotermes secundus]|nr:hypothetical protein B7P43_G01410 [Cryptotermes secundus]PNF34890.1 hypothetical protein B7P43_G01410 [Cryptotermes secundus]
MSIRKEIPAGGIVCSIVSAPDSSGAVVQLADGTLLIYSLDQNEMVKYLTPLPEACETLQVSHIDGKDISLGLSRRNRLYVDGQEVANNVTSFVVHSEFILLTTLKHVLLCARLNDKGLQSLIRGQCGPGRRIERGARLVTSVAGGTCVVLQMPRGNLECIQPRPLTLHVATVHLDAGQYGPAFQLLRKQRINLNLLCDHQPMEFLAKIEHVINELRDPAWLSLFLSELQEDSVAHSMYKEYYAHLDQLPATLNNKVQAVCDAMRDAMLCRENADQYLLPILTSCVQKQTDKDLEDALIRVKTVKEAERKNANLMVSADDAMKYLLYLVDVNRLYDVALGLYDFDLVMQVAAKSNKDPKEYLPFLNKLRRMDPNYSYFVIDKHLKRFESALNHIALCQGDEYFEECLNLVKTHKLYSKALDIFPKGSPKYLDIATIYGDYLMDKKLYHEAGVMYTRAQEYQKALAAYQVAGDWRETLLTANQLQYKENKLHELCQELASSLKDRRQFSEASKILCDYLGDVEESIAVLAQGRLWNEAVWSSYHHKRADMIETHVKPGIMEHLEQLTSQFMSAQKEFITYKSRLNVVRTNKEQRQIEEKDGDPLEEYDIYSDTSSVMASTLHGSHIGSQVSMRSSRSSKNRRKLQRKMLSLKEGSVYEELALIRALHQLITATNNATEEVESLCRVLLKFDKDKEATSLQKLLSDLMQDMDNAKNEIWTTDLLQQPQMSYGSDATVNSIINQHQSALNPGLALLEPHFRFPPQNKSISWKISILNTA